MRYKISTIVSSSIFVAALAFSGSQPATASEKQDNMKVQPVAVGDTFTPYTLEDQHEEKHSLSKSTRRVIISTNMELSKGIHKWLSEKEPTFLEDNKTEYVSDITDMPGIITWLFARPKMQKYPFKILLADDENFSKHYPAEEEKIAVFDLDEKQSITKIKFVENAEELSKLPPAEKKVVAANFEQQMKNLATANKR